MFCVCIYQPLCTSAVCINMLCVLCIMYMLHCTSLPLHKTLLGRMRCLGCISNHCNQHCNDSAVHTQCIKHAICTAACVDINQCAWMDLGVGYQRFARVDCVFLCGLSSLCCVLFTELMCLELSSWSPWTELMCLQQLEHRSNNTSSLSFHLQMDGGDSPKRLGWSPSRSPSR